MPLQQLRHQYYARWGGCAGSGEREVTASWCPLTLAIIKPHPAQCAAPFSSSLIISSHRKESDKRWVETAVARDMWQNYASSRHQSVTKTTLSTADIGSMRGRTLSQAEHSLSNDISYSINLMFSIIVTTFLLKFLQSFNWKEQVTSYVLLVFLNTQIDSAHSSKPLLWLHCSYSSLNAQLIKHEQLSQAAENSCR